MEARVNFRRQGEKGLRVCTELNSSVCLQQKQQWATQSNVAPMQLQEYNQPQRFLLSVIRRRLLISATATFVSHNAKALAGATSTTSSATSAAALWH